MKITIDIEYTLLELKKAKCKHMGGNPKDEKRADIQVWLGSLVQADVDDIVNHDENDC